MRPGLRLAEQDAHEADQRRHDDALREQSVDRVQVHGVASPAGAGTFAASCSIAGASSCSIASHSGEKVHRQIALR
ncbi:MAG: hypothetical protein ACK559_02770, partial [bacterium]